MAGLWLQYRTVCAPGNSARVGQCNRTRGYSQSGEGEEKITLTATVTTNKKAATGGTVTFFDGKLSLGSAQVVGKKAAKEYKTGTAILTTIVSPGFHAVTAVYGGTAVSPKWCAPNRSALEITGKTISAAVLTAKAIAKNPKNYDFTASVSVSDGQRPQKRWTSLTLQRTPIWALRPSIQRRRRMVLARRW